MKLVQCGTRRAPRCSLFCPRRRPKITTVQDGLPCAVHELPLRSSPSRRMLDHCLVLRKNGVLLWRQSWAPMKGNPVDSLIRTVLMEVRRCTGSAGLPS